MPEAPEVEALASFVRERLAGHTVREVALVEGRAMKTRSRSLEELIGRTLTAATRYGKHLDLDFGGVHVGIGFGRAGWATWTEPADSAANREAESGASSSEPADSPSAPAAVIARIVFPHGILSITDAGAWLSVQLHVVEAAEEVPAVAKLGPDAAAPGYSRAMLADALGGRRKQLKALLQEQDSIAGIGNAYSYEILFAARISPTAHAAVLSDDDITRLHHALHDTLTAAVIARRGVPLAQQKASKVAAMRVHGRTGEPCPDCDGVIEDIPGTKGGGQWCPACQAAPLPQ